MPPTPTTRVVDVGVGSLLAPLSPLTGGRLGPLMEMVDDRFGIRVDVDGVEVRRPWWTTHIGWEQVGEVHLDSRLDRVATVAASFVPVGRVPLLGPLLARSVDTVVESVTTRLTPGLRERAGWTVATFTRPGWRPDVDLAHGIAVTALLRPALTDVVVGHARARDIPVMRDEG